MSVVRNDHRNNRQLSIAPMGPAVTSLLDRRITQTFIPRSQVRPGQAIGVWKETNFIETGQLTGITSRAMAQAMAGSPDSPPRKWNLKQNPSEPWNIIIAILIGRK